MMEVISPHVNVFKVKNKNMKFPFKVYEAVIMIDRIIVSYNWSELKEKLKDFDSDRAVWCYDFEGNILWYVEKPYYIDKGSNHRTIYDQPVDTVGADPKTEKLYAYSRRGYELDPYTGRLSNDFEIR